MCRQPAASFHTANPPCSHLSATASEDNAALGSLQASPQAPGQTTGLAGAQTTSPKMTQQMRDPPLTPSKKVSAPSSPCAARRLYRNLSGKFRVGLPPIDDSLLPGRGDKERLRKSCMFQSNEALFEAVEHQELDLVQLLLSQYSLEELDLNTPNSEGLLPLDIAIMTNNVPMARILLQAGAKESPHFVSLESRSLHLATLVREAEQRVSDLTAQVVNEAPGERDGSEREKQLKGWEWRHRLFKRMKAGFEHARPPEAPSNVRLSVCSSSTLRVTFHEPFSVNSAVVTKYRVEWSCSPSFFPVLGEAAIEDLKALQYTITALCPAQYFRIYSQEVLEFGEKVSFLLLLPPSDDVCTAPGQNNPYSPRSGFLTLPLQIFELVHFYTYSQAFIGQYCRVSALLELESLMSQQTLREAFSESELLAAKQKHQQVQEHMQQMEEVWREMRWIMDALQYARYKQPSGGISLAWIIDSSQEVVREKPRSTTSSQLDYLPSPTPSPETGRKHNSESCKVQPHVRKHSVSKSLRHLFQPTSKFVKTLKSFWVSEWLIWLHGCMVRRASHTPRRAQVSCLWEDISWLRQCLSPSQSSCSCILQTRLKMLQAVSQLQGMLGTQDLGRVYFEPIKDRHGNALLVTIRDLGSSQSLENMRWILLSKLQMQRKSISSPEEPTALDMLLITLHEKLAYHRRSKQALSPGLYLGYLKLCSSVDQIRVLVPQKLPNMLCHVKVRHNHNVSREEWEWLQNLSSLDDSVLAEQNAESPQNLILQDLRAAARELMGQINIPVNQAQYFRIYSQEVLEFGEKVSFLLLLPPSDDVCTAPGQNNPYSPRSGFLTLPLQIFELVHFYTYSQAFIGQYCRVSALLELESLMSQQTLREAFSESELLAAKQKHQQVQEHMQQMEEVWREMRWIMDALQYARYKQPSGGISLAWIIDSSQEVVREKPRSTTSSQLDYLPSPTPSPETGRKHNSAYRCLDQTAPSYLQTLISPYTPTRPLCSACTRRLALPPLRSPASRARSFSTLAPQWWNDLPTDVRTAQSLTTFRRLLKTHLFKQHL
ncbi:UNVERIFIED_CONTAM: hypothetical protein FKN15_023779 [Acipenser sinensis]